MAEAPASSARYDSSLGLLTKKFVALIKSQPHGSLDLNHAAAQLGVQKRRIYDITNVLEGIGLIEKTTKNNIAWKGNRTPHPDDEPSSSEDEDDEETLRVRHEAEALRAEAATLDNCVEHLERARAEFARTHASDLSVTHADLRAVPGLSDETIIALRAPPGTDLEVPDPHSTSTAKYQLRLRSPLAPIEVFLVDRADREDSEDREVARLSANASLQSAARPRSGTPPEQVARPVVSSAAVKTPPSFATPRILAKHTPNADQLDKDFVFDPGTLLGTVPTIPKIPQP